METWAIASLYTFTIIWIYTEAKSQVQFVQRHQNYNEKQLTRAPKQFGYLLFPKGKFGEVVPQLHSTSSLKPQFRPTFVNFNHPITKNINGAYPIYVNLNDDFQQNLGLQDRRPQTFTNQEANERQGNEEHLENPSNYDDYRTSQVTNILGPHQVETIQSEHYHKGVPAFEVTDFQHHQNHESHGEVHYHQHKHIHKHEHKQEHVHQHKNKHDHKHLHDQEHKHDHHSEHKHGHQHKHDHHQDHQHNHHHDHKHDHHQDHKHDHHHGHKHQHHNEHEHNHGHKHEQKHGHEHKHKHHHSKRY